MSILIATIGFLFTGAVSASSAGSTTSTNSSDTRVNAGVETMPDGCLVLYGEALTPVPVSILSTLSVQFLLAIYSVASNPSRFSYFSIRDSYLSLLTVLLLVYQIVNACYILYLVTHLPPAYESFTSWDLYTLFYLRLWNSGFFASLLGSFTSSFLAVASRMSIAKIILNVSSQHWHAESPNPKAHEPVYQSERSKLLLPHGVDTVVAVSCEDPLPNCCEKSCCPRSRNYVNPVLRRAYWQRQNVGWNVEYRMWRAWTYGPLDELHSMDTVYNPFSKLPDYFNMRSYAICVFISHPYGFIVVLMLLMLSPSFITHIMGMFFFFALVLPSCAVFPCYFLYSGIFASPERITGYGHDPRIVSMSDKFRIIVYSAFNIVIICFPAVYVSVTLLALFHHSVILYSSGAPIDYFDITRVWWQLCDMGCFITRMKSSISSVIDFVSYFI